MLHIKVATPVQAKLGMSHPARGALKKSPKSAKKGVVSSLAKKSPTPVKRGRAARAAAPVQEIAAEQVTTEQPAEPIMKGEHMLFIEDSVITMLIYGGYVRWCISLIKAHTCRLFYLYKIVVFYHMK